MIFKKGGKLGQGVGALKRGAGTPLRCEVCNVSCSIRRQGTITTLDFDFY